jgi:hypothetical protein
VGIRKILGFHHAMTLIISCLYSGIGGKRPLVRRSSTHSDPVKLTLAIQLFDHTRYHGLKRRWEASMADFYFDFRDVDKQNFTTFFPLSSSDFLLNQISVAIYSVDSILHMTVEYLNPVIALWWNVSKKC